MLKKLSTFLFWTGVLCACAPLFPSTQAAPPASPPTALPPTVEQAVTAPAFTDAPALPIPRFSRTLETPHIDLPADGPSATAPPDTQGCAYNWAYKDLPELAGAFQQSIQALQPQAQANVYIFGETCAQADGSSIFLPRETDFDITLQAADLSNPDELGGWIVQVMQVISAIPADQIAGPGPGRVKLIFQSNGQQTGVTFYINQYQALPAGLSNTQIYNSLINP